MITVPVEIAENAKRLIEIEKDLAGLEKKILSWIEGFDLEIEMRRIQIVTGEVDEGRDGRILRIKGNASATYCPGGYFCHQVTLGEDWYRGELYFLIQGDQYLRICYDKWTTDISKEGDCRHCFYYSQCSIRQIIRWLRKWMTMFGNQLQIKGHGCSGT